MKQRVTSESCSLNTLLLTLIIIFITLEKHKTLITRKISHVCCFRNEQHRVTVFFLYLILKVANSETQYYFKFILFFFFVFFTSCSSSFLASRFRRWKLVGRYLHFYVILLECVFLWSYFSLLGVMLKRKIGDASLTSHYW